MQRIPPSIGRLAVTGVAWSVLQSWGGRLITFLLFVLLARYLDPATFGMASIAVIVLGLITLIAEFGFADAVVQRRDLEPEDVDLPFYVSVVAAMALAVGIALAAGRLEVALGVAGLAPVLVALVPVAPLTTIARFQEMNVRRALGFRRLAFRVLVANLVGGIVAVACAASGAGVWSLVVQAYVIAVVGLVWLWSRPIWRPGLELRPGSFLALARFGLPLAVLRLADFASVRFYEVLLIGRHGIAAYGLYAVGARLYETLLGLLQGAIGEVSLAILARIQHDRERLAEAYRRTLVLAAFLTAPVFVLAAALIPEISAVLFGGRWDGVDGIVHPLLLLGALQALYFFNGSFLAARGRSGAALLVSLTKSIAIPLTVVLMPSGDVVALVRIFALAQLTEAPFSFFITLRELRLSGLRLAADLLPAVAACAAAHAAVDWSRAPLAQILSGPLVNGVALGLVFAMVYGIVAVTIGFRQIGRISAFVRERLASR